LANTGFQTMYTGNHIGLGL